MSFTVFSTALLHAVLAKPGPTKRRNDKTWTQWYKLRFRK